MGNIYTNFDFSVSLFSSYEPVRDGEIDRWILDRLTGKMLKATYRMAV